ncbi:MAG: PGPGW domain-containing protein [Desulfuromonadaceae bacterium]|nr:PGPGW domain-containing protein [Desulfuromonadaceae bacterium]
MERLIPRTLDEARRVIKIVIGFSILVVGIAMLVVPGPALIVIPIGLSIVGTEFLWARKLLDTVRLRILHMKKVRTMPCFRR